MSHLARGPVDNDPSVCAETESERTPGPVVAAAGVLALLICVTNFALGQAVAGVYAAIIGLLSFGAGLSWLVMDRTRIRQAERNWPLGHG